MGGCGGLIVLVVPWLLGFSSISAALWNCLVIGGVLAIGNGYMAYSQGGTQVTARIVLPRADNT